MFEEDKRKKEWWTDDLDSKQPDEEKFYWGTGWGGEENV